MYATSKESVFLPSIGLSLPAGEAVEVTDAQAAALASHPFITLSGYPAAITTPDSSVAQATESEES